MNFYKHYIGDYQRDTGHLSLAEHGAYRLMLDAFYATGKPLPADRKALYRLLRAATQVERKAIDSVCAQFWETTSAGLTNRRAALESKKAEKQAEINRQIAVEREKKKRQRLEEVSALSPYINTGMEEIIGNGALSDPVHESDKVFEVCRVNNTHIVSGLQPFSCTNRATKEEPSVERQDAGEGGLSREPIHNQSHNHNQNQNMEGCGNTATSHRGQEKAHEPDSGCARENASLKEPSACPENPSADVVSGDPGEPPSGACDRGQAALDDGGEMKNVSVSLARAMQGAGIVARSGDPRLMALATQGVDVETVVAACSEAKRARPNEKIGMAYVVKIVERWARDANAIAARGARAHGRVCVHEERKRALNELTGRVDGESVPPFSGLPFTVDGSVRLIGEEGGGK